MTACASSSVAPGTLALNPKQYAQVVGFSFVILFSLSMGQMRHQGLKPSAEVACKIHVVQHLMASEYEVDV